VVAQRDAQDRAQSLEEFEMGTGALGKLAAVDQLICRALDPAAAHAADVQLGQSAVGAAGNGVAAAAQAGDNLPYGRLALLQTDGDGDAGRGAGGDAVVELGDGAVAEQPDEGAIGAGALRDGDGQQGLAALTGLGALGDMTQSVEIDVGPRNDGNGGSRF